MDAVDLPRDHHGRQVTVGDALKSSPTALEQHEGCVVLTRNIFWRNKDEYVRLDAPNLLLVRHGACCRFATLCSDAANWVVVSRLTVWDHIQKSDEEL